MFPNSKKCRKPIEVPDAGNRDLLLAGKPDPVRFIFFILFPVKHEHGSWLHRENTGVAAWSPRKKPEDL